jgi:c-di-GMP-binding flagellar brake protein YcgR
MKRHLQEPCLSDSPIPRGPRIPLDVVVMRADDVEPGIYAAVDISFGGMCLISQRKEKVGGFVALSFSLDDEPINVYAEVVWCRSDHAKGADTGLHTAGLKFVTISPSVQRAIQAYIERRAGDDAAS